MNEVIRGDWCVLTYFARPGEDPIMHAYGPYPTRHKAVKVQRELDASVASAVPLETKRGGVIYSTVRRLLDVTPFNPNPESWEDDE